MAKTAKPRGYVIYEGPSRIDGAPIVVIATGFKSASQNAKTGAMIQTWIFRADMDPVKALQTGSDVSICGGCPHRPKAHTGTKYSERTCYVRIDLGPLTIWNSWQRGIYPKLAASQVADVFAGRLVRLGAYGDPAAVPFVIWALVVQKAAGKTGYSHQWKSEKYRDVMAFCQASVDNPAELVKARALGFGTFRVRGAGEALAAGEIICPAGAEVGKKTTCEACRMCDGTGKNIAIVAHGIGAAMFEKRVRVSLPVLA